LRIVKVRRAKEWQTAALEGTELTGNIDRKTAPLHPCDLLFRIRPLGDASVPGDSDMPPTLLA